jgi:UDP-N-acetylmuramoyl-tripeptide--D-alanyl-D-alanine ligase
MVDRLPQGVEAARLLAVPDTQAGLEALARAARARSEARIIAVTGSVGKTGTKEALAALLARQGTAHASAGNLNNQIGMPLSLARMPATSRFGIFEIGMNHAGEIAPLSALLRPHAAIVTNVEAVHLEFFPNVEAIADAKAEIFVGLDSDGVAILNRDNRHFARLAARAEARGVGRIWSFGEGEEADARLISASAGPAGSSVEARVLGRPIRFQINIPGRHQVVNALAALLGVAALGGDVTEAAAGLADLKPVKGRGVSEDIPVEGGAVRLVDESYNASPAAMRAAFSVLAMAEPGAGGRKIVALGDMLELGEAAAAEHAGLADALLAAKVDQVFTVGPLMRHLEAALPRFARGGHADQSAALAPLIAAAVRPGDIVLVKGSAASRMDIVVDALRAKSKTNSGGGRRAL